MFRIFYATITPSQIGQPRCAKISTHSNGPFKVIPRESGTERWGLFWLGDWIVRGPIVPGPGTLRRSRARSKGKCEFKNIENVFWTTLDDGLLEFEFVFLLLPHQFFFWFKIIYKFPLITFISNNLSKHFKMA